jgi:GNAT superfamily N-acetyltransferase
LIADQGSRPGLLTLRPATARDLPGCEAVWRDGLNGYLRPLGVPDVPLENPGLRRLHAHTLATDPERFWVAAGPDGSIAGFGSAVLRGPVWFLSMLFVEPADQARGLGRSLLERILPAATSDGITLATATDSVQPISNALYASIGIVPRIPTFNLVGRPRPDAAFPDLPSGLRAQPLDGDGGGANAAGAGAALEVEIDELDRSAVGFAHPEDHGFIHRDSRLGFAYRDASGRLLGYGYASEAGRVGPIAAREPSLLAPILGHVLTAIEPRGASSVWLPGPADQAITVALRAGLRIEGFPVLLCWSQPFADFARYVPISPGLL